eukprot:GFUD01042927.1.p1 GENE.GFUD01042927.1~~GFUD01042927.1.p1  ORF type:complete len:335 (-),score=76.87 GFUD01042927.1:184-1188(-)
MGSEKFCLRWNDFESNISVAFRELRDDKDFFDVTLACDDDQIQAHKVILSACSPFFRNILRRNPHQNPLLYLKGVKYTDLQYVLNFMYHGEVNVAQEELNSFLSVAEDLRIKGLTQTQPSGPVNNKKEVNTSSTTPAAPRPSYHQPDPCPKRPRPVQTLQPSKQAVVEEDEIQEVVPIKSEPREQPPALISQPQSVSNAASSQEIFASQTVATADESFGYDDSYEDYGEYAVDQDAGAGDGVEYSKDQTFQDPIELLQFVRRDPQDQKFYCTLCEKFSHKVKPLARNHVESQHFPNIFNYPCDQCEESFDTKSKSNLHRQRKHKQNKNQQFYNV